MESFSFIGKKHLERLPTVRISRIHIENFKDVKNGVVEFACSKTFVPEGTQSDILGIYGQNGSGKTTLIQLIRIIQKLLSGHRISPKEADLISVGSNTGKCEICFDFQYPNSDVREVIYSFEMGKEVLTEDIKKSFDEDDDPRLHGATHYPFLISEKVECSGSFNGVKIKKQPLLGIDNNDNYFPSTKMKDYFVSDDKNELEKKLIINSAMAKKESRSSLFSDEMFCLFRKNTQRTNYVEIIKELRLFADHFLFAFSSNTNVFVRGNFVLPIFTEKGPIPLDIDEPNIVPKEVFEMIRDDIGQVSSVLCKWIPGLQLDFANVVETIDKKGREAVQFDVVSKRGDRILPIRYEADGVRKIIMYLKLIINAFNQKSTTVAIDELDAGVFEFLLGEMLELFEKHGRGQLIFTSHNLRPLEVLDKKFLCFTTSNPNNRYIHMKSVGHTNNLRLLYLKEIMLGGTQNEELYKKEKQFAILGAIKKCGLENGD